MATKGGKFERLGAAYPISHPARAAIIALLRKEIKSYPAKIARTLELNERLVSFHLSMLSARGFVDSEYGLANPPSPPRVVRYYRLTSKVDEVLEQFVSDLK